MKARWLAAATCAALCVAAPAGAQPSKPVDYDAAKKQYQAGEDAVGRGDHAEAAKRYGMAYEITKDPVLFYKIATAYDAAGDCRSAVIYYRRYLAEAKPEQRFAEKTEAKIAACTDKPAAATGETPPPTGERPAPTAPSPTTPAPQSTDSESLPAAAGPPVFVGTEPSWMQTAAWASVGAVVTFGTIGAVLGLSASSREEDIENLFATQGEPEPYEGAIKERYDELVDEGQQLETFAYVSFGVAGLAAITAVMLFVLDDSHPAPPAVDAVGGTIAPSIGPRDVGVTAVWSF